MNNKDGRHILHSDIGIVCIGIAMQSIHYSVLLTFDLRSQCQGQGLASEQMQSTGDIATTSNFRIFRSPTLIPSQTQTLEGQKEG